jgi:hypothetical protein
MATRLTNFATVPAKLLNHARYPAMSAKQCFASNRESVLPPKILVDSSRFAVIISYMFRR